MKILKINANNYKNCKKDFVINFVPIAQKSVYDKEFELLKIDDELYTYTTLGIIGKNASGKTTTVELLSLVYSILGTYRLDNKSTNTLNYIEDSFNIDITFYENKMLYRYITDIYKIDDIVGGQESRFVFKNEKIFEKKYTKTNSNKIFDYDTYEEKKFEFINKPEDVSLLFVLFNKNTTRGIYYSCNDLENYAYDKALNLIKNMSEKDNEMFSSIIKLFDENIESIEVLSNDKYKLIMKNKKPKYLSSYELHELLSAGTSKGIILMSYVCASLLLGVDLIIDEIENHFHKTLAENIINLYKDKMVNKNNASLIITTHYCELLDLFNRSDNIYISHNDGKIFLENMYTKYGIRSDVLKSKRFYNNMFNTNVNYDSLMDLKKELMK